MTYAWCRAAGHLRSPVFICTHGTLSGGLDATYDFVADTRSDVFPTASLTGRSTITTDKGVLIGQDTAP